ncbi:hypothetical protein [Mesorhizobium sp. M0296]|uniref:hypothetical protein n=1 Tax=Mesorhizobium sp. M0296 TaxID=2956931 RepID=UPI003339A865
MLPFSTDLLADFLEFRTAVLVYWFNLLMLGLTLLASWRYADKNGFLAEGVDAETTRTVYLRIVKAQILWAVGAALLPDQPVAQRRLHPGGAADLCRSAARATAAQGHRVIRAQALRFSRRTPR